MHWKKVWKLAKSYTSNSNNQLFLNLYKHIFSRSTISKTLTFNVMDMHQSNVKYLTMLVTLLHMKYLTMLVTLLNMKYLTMLVTLLNMHCRQMSHVGFDLSQSYPRFWAQHSSSSLAVLTCSQVTSPSFTYIFSHIKNSLWRRFCECNFRCCPGLPKYLNTESFQILILKFYTQHFQQLNKYLQHFK